MHCYTLTAMNGCKRTSVLTVDLTDDLSRRVNRIASDIGLSPSEIVRTAIRHGIKEFGQDGCGQRVADNPTRSGKPSRRRA